MALEPDSPLDRARAAVRRVAIDVGPLRASRDFRLLWIGQLISLTGRQLTTVALPWQVFLLTNSSLAVGLIGLVQVVPLIALSVAGGAIADRWDRRKVILWTELGMTLSSARGRSARCATGCSASRSYSASCLPCL